MDAFSHYEKKEVDEDSLPEYTIEEVAEHDSYEDAWIVIYGKVYDVTEWQHDHPGGDDILIRNAGKDVSELFRNVGHSPDANEIRPNFMVGKLVKRKSQPVLSESTLEALPAEREQETVNGNSLLKKVEEMEQKLEVILEEVQKLKAKL